MKTQKPFLGANCLLRYYNFKAHLVLVWDLRSTFKTKALDMYIPNHPILPKSYMAEREGTPSQTNNIEKNMIYIFSQKSISQNHIFSEYYPHISQNPIFLNPIFPKSNFQKSPFPKITFSKNHIFTNYIFPQSHFSKITLSKIFFPEFPLFQNPIFSRTQITKIPIQLFGDTKS